MATTIPENIVIMWSGAIVDIPGGWFLCNGANGTPDLRNRFVVGSGSTYSFTQTGGNANAVVVSHGHNFTGISGSGAHSHTVPVHWGSDPNSSSHAGGTIGINNLVNFSLARTINFTANGVGNHSHSGGSVNASGASATNANLPPYYALAYLMKGTD